jgi:hypothetical protein
MGTFFDVPAHLYRQAAGDALGWVGALVAGRSARAFHYEVRLRFFGGFFFTRAGECLKRRVTQRHERSDAPRAQARQLLPPQTAGGLDRSSR